MAEGGCLKNILAGVGCLTLMTVGGVVGWQYRAQLGGLYRSVIERDSTGRARQAGADTIPSVGRPSQQALDSARSKQAAMSRRDGPGYVTLSADEMASLVSAGLGIAGRAAVDSIVVTLDENRLGLQAVLNTSLLGAALPDPLRGILGASEPIRVSGGARVAAVGAVAWEPDSFVVRSFPFPRSAVPVLVNKLTGRPDGVVPIPVPRTVGDLRIRPSGVTFYRR